MIGQARIQGSECWNTKTSLPTILSSSGRTSASSEHPCASCGTPVNTDGKAETCLLNNLSHFYGPTDFTCMKTKSCGWKCSELNPSSASAHKCSHEQLQRKRWTHKQYFFKALIFLSKLLVIEKHFSTIWHFKTLKHMFLLQFCLLDYFHPSWARTLWDHVVRTTAGFAALVGFWADALPLQTFLPAAVVGWLGFKIIK